MEEVKRRGPEPNLWGGLGKGKDYVYFGVDWRLALTLVL